MRLTVLILLLTWNTYGQDNLVPNPSFEDYTECPQNISHKLKVKDEVIPHWYTPTLGTPDYYHSCSESIKSRIGDNWIGNSIPEEGEGFIGMLIEDEVREYIQVKLLEPLKAGVQYDLELITAHANKTNYASNGISMMFTHLPTIIDDFENIYGYSALQNKGEFPGLEDNDWHYLSGTYIASGGEQYLTLGNTQINSIKKHVKSKNGHDYCYYFFDYVSVTESAELTDVINEPNDMYYPSCVNNLVQNGSFEFHENCVIYPTPDKYVSGSRIAPFWHTVGTAQADVFNVCQGEKLEEADKFKLRQSAYRGDYMAGFSPYKAVENGSEYEYLLGFLKTPLTKGKKYYISYEVNLAKSSLFSISNFGIQFNSQVPLKNDSELIIGTHIENMDNSIKNSGWSKVQGTYLANGDESSFLIGAFGENTPETATMIEGIEGLQEAYYFIDNVIVVEDSGCFVSNENQAKPKNISMIIDGSIHMESTAQNMAIKRLLRGLDERDVLSIYSAGPKPKAVFENESVKQYSTIESELAHIHPKGTAKINESLKLWRSSFKDNPDTEIELIILIHGKSNYSEIEKSILNLPTNVNVHVIGIDFEASAVKKINSIMNSNNAKFYQCSRGNCLAQFNKIFNRE